MIWSRGRGTLSGSSVQIRCEQAQTQEVTTAPENAGGPRFPDMVEKLAPGTGQLDVAWWTVGGLGWAKRSVARVALAQLETLESAPTPLGSAAAAK